MALVLVVVGTTEIVYHINISIKKYFNRYGTTDALQIPLKQVDSLA